MDKRKMEEAMAVLESYSKTTPGKADDFLESGACFLEELAHTLRYANENYVDADGTFQDIKIAEVDKWLPIVRYVLQRAQDIAEKCFDTDIVPDAKSEVVKLLLGWLGLRVGN